MTARIIVTGNAATAPLVRVTRTGRKVANFRVGSNERYQDRESGQWVDGGSFFVSVACWGALADNVEASVRLGMALVVTGKISQRSYTDSDDKVHFAYEIQAESVGPDLNRGTAEFTKANRTSGPSVSLDESGEPVIGVFDDPVGRPGLTGRGTDEVRVRPDGSFGLPSGEQVAYDDDASGSPDREPSELVGAAG